FFIPAWGKDYFLLRIIICGSRGWRQRHWLVVGHAGFACATQAGVSTPVEGYFHTESVQVVTAFTVLDMR
ncbi:MAG: hypothetical protein AB2811_11950, partial [Candidatus Sedimenticola endophacoides]